MLKSIFIASLFLVQSLGHTYDITNAIKATMKNNTNLKEAQINLERYKVNLFAASSSFLPSIGASSTSQSTMDDLDLSGKGRTDRITIATEIFSGGEGLFGMRAAALASEAGKVRYKANLNNIIIKTVQAYQTVITARDLYKVAQQNVDNLNKIVKESEIKLSLGTITRPNLLEAQARLAQALSQKEKNFADMKDAEGEFEYVTGEKAPVKLDGLEIKNLSLPKNYEDFILTVEEKNPVIIATTKELKSAQFSTKAAKSALLPTVSAQAQLIRQDSRDFLGRNQEVSGSTYLLSVTLPIFQRGQEYVQIKNALLKEDASFNARRDTLLKVHKEATGAWNDFFQAKASLQASSDSVKFYEAFMKGAKEEFNLGTKTLTDLLQAQIDYQNAENQLIQYKARVILSALNLKAFLGEIDKIDFSKLVVK